MVQLLSNNAIRKRPYTRPSETHPEQIDIFVRIPGKPSPLYPFGSDLYARTVGRHYSSANCRCVSKVALCRNQKRRKHSRNSGCKTSYKIEIGKQAVRTSFRLVVRSILHRRAKKPRVYFLSATSRSKEIF